MGRLKAWQNLNPLFSGRYKKLLEEYGSKDYCKLILQENIQDSLSYSCGRCGHSQTLQAEELNSIVGHAFRLAYAAHLQKAATTGTNTCAKDISTLGAPHASGHQIIGRSPSPSHVHLHSNTHTHLDQKPCDQHCLQRNVLLQGDRCTNSSSSNSSLSGHSSHCNSFLSSQNSCGDLVNMRTPGSTAATIHTTQTPPPSDCVGTGVKPSTLPGLLHHNHNNNLLHSPDSDISNSPTELNSTRRITDKPPLVKKVTLGNVSEPLVSCCSSESSSSQAPSVNTGSTGSSTSTAVVGYINEHAPTTTLAASDHIHSSTITKCMTPDIGIDVVDCPLTGECTVSPPPLPERSDSLTPPEEPHLKAAAWFQAGIPREIALEVLSREPVGAFMVRESTSKPGCYALSLRVPRDFTVSGIAHYLIVKSSRGYKIKGFTKDFPTLTALITHHSVMPELLPCPLSLNRYNPTFTNEDQNKNDSNDEDPDYNTLSDFRKMMADLNV